MAPSAPTGKGRTILPIEGLSPYQNDSTIKARVTHKSPIKTWSNPRGDGKFFRVTLMDDTGEIRATGFNIAVDAFYHKLEEGKVYYISKGRVIAAQKKFSNVQNDYEMQLDGKNTIVEECVDASSSSLPMVRYNFIPLSSLEEQPIDSTCDVIGIVKKASGLTEVVSKTSNKPVAKRDLTIVDKSLYSIRMAIWGKQAEGFTADNSPVVAVKGVKVNDFGGRNLSMMASSIMTISPDIEEAHSLRAWYDDIGAGKSFRSHSHMIPSGGLSSTGFNRNEMRHLSDIKESQIGTSDKAVLFSFRATIMHIKNEGVAYPACSMQSCSKKVVEVSDGWRCERCEKTFDRPEYRYIVSMVVSDWSNQVWLQGFNDTGLAVFGKTAGEIMEIKERDDAEYKALVAQSAGKTFNFNCRAKQDTYNDCTRVRYGISKMSPVDYNEEAKHLRNLLMESNWAMRGK